MKKQFLLILIVLVFGSLAIFLPSFLSSNKQESKLAQEKNVQKQAKDIYMKEFISKPNVIKSSDKTLKQIQGKNKIYFEGIDKLNPFFKANQMEIIKNKIQFYVHSNISNDLLECTLKPETIKRVGNKVSFELIMKNIKKFEVLVTEDKNNEIIDFTIFHSL